VSARTIGAQFAARLGFSTVESALLATVISDLARAIQNIGPGEITFNIIHDGARRGVEIVAHHDTATAAASISNAGALTETAKIVDEFSVASSAETGTIVTLKKWRGAAK